MSGTSGVEGIAQTISDQVDTENDKNYEKTGEDPHPPRAADQEGLRLLHHITPGRGGLLNAKTQE